MYLEIQETLKQFISEELLNTRDTIDGDDNLLIDGMVDSIGMLRLVAFIEESYNLKVPYEDLTIENFGTVTVIADYLQRRQVSKN
ncbi:unnamed protein product [marine sediment metagenome]|uniref:Carrier domain-containing protein n=1 Tax=marine sediment metagenome TaxID=412755 RepID=X0SY32_9ZZZZ